MMNWLKYDERRAAALIKTIKLGPRNQQKGNPELASDHHCDSCTSSCMKKNSFESTSRHGSNAIVCISLENWDRARSPKKGCLACMNIHLNQLHSFVNSNRRIGCSNGGRIQATQQQKTCRTMDQDAQRCLLKHQASTRTAGSIGTGMEIRLVNAVHSRASNNHNCNYVICLIIICYCSRIHVV